MKDLKLFLQAKEFLVILDFSENYSFVLQDAAQSYHWSKEQATIHPFGIYYKNDNNEIKHTNLVVISDCLEHNTIAVHLFQRHLISFLKNQFEEVEKLCYFSDGSAAQYKNKKNFYNLSMHEEEFNIKAEWNFFSTSHGKNVCDGLGGTLKRLATKANLQKTHGDGIKTPLQLYEWAIENIQNMNFQYVSMKDYEGEKQILEERFLNLKPISSTRKIHQVQPVSRGIVQVKIFSSSLESFEYSLK